ncbi:hypothetical protein FOZ60_010017 [Perkinsus olseni]|uniref:Uncharacterized protein n=1 Tax=Perkinsus olseni TaxID=32597 RepID=A0A7J6NG90_PEROL|nr:hypothetical protein FOZ60_010017 [Perkinsus olseni]
MSSNVDAIWAEMQQEWRASSKKTAQPDPHNPTVPLFAKKRDKKPRRPKEMSLWLSGGTAAKGSSGRVLYDAFATKGEIENCAGDNRDDAKPRNADGDMSNDSRKSFSSVPAMVDWLHTAVPLVLVAAEHREGTEQAQPADLDEQLNDRLLSRFRASTAPDLADAALEFLLRPLVRLCLSPETSARDTSRLAACRVLANLLSSCGDAHLVTTVPYLVPYLVTRLNCGDLDGVAGVPEKMRPLPEQKPQQMARADGREVCEEVRKEIARLVMCLLGRVSGKPTVLVQSIDEIVSLVRGLVLDDFGKIKLIGCEACEVLCDAHAPLLLHFGESMARSASSCLTHNHMQVRIAGLRAVTACLKTTTWKHSFDIIAHLTAWSDPNQVPVKAFYEGTTKVNYLTMLCFDRHIAVRRFFYQTLGHWLLNLEDSIDIEPHVMPFFLTGLFDDDYSTRILVFALIEKVGEKYEKMNEVDLREKRQLGLDAAWTYDGRASDIPFLPLVHGVHHELVSAATLFDIKDYDWPLMAELVTSDRVAEIAKTVAAGKPVPRPRLGARCWVRTSARRFILATLNQVTDFKECNALNAARLLAVLVGFVEEGATEWLKQIITAAQRVYLGRSGDDETRTETNDVFDLVITMIGRYLDPQAWWGLLSSDLSSESLLEDEWRITSVKILGLLLKGALEVYDQHCLPEAPSESRCHSLYGPIISSLYASDLLVLRVTASREAFQSVLVTLSSASDFDHFGPQRKKFIACELLLQMPRDGRIPSVVDLVAADADPLRAANLVKKIIDAGQRAPEQTEWLLRDVHSEEIDAVVEMMILEEAFRGISVVLVLRSVVSNRASIEIVHRHLEAMVSATSTASVSARQVAVAVLTRDIALEVCSEEGPPHAAFYKALIGSADTRPRQLLELLAAAYSLGTAVASTARIDTALLGSLITAVADHTLDKRLRDIWEQETRIADPSFRQLKVIREASSRVVELVRLQAVLAVAMVVRAQPTENRDDLVGPLLEVLECPAEQHGKIAKPPSPGMLIYVAHTVMRLLAASSPVELMPEELCSDAPRLCSVGFGQPVSMIRLAGREELAERIIKACVDTICSTLNLSFPVDPGHPETPVPPDVVIVDLTPARVEVERRRGAQVPGIWHAHDLAPLVSRPAWEFFYAQYGTEARKKMADNCRPPYETGLRWNAALAVGQLLDSVVKEHPSAATRYGTVLEKQGLMARVALLREVQRRVR